MGQFMGYGKHLCRLAVSRVNKQKRCVFITQHKTTTLFNCNGTVRIIIYHTVKYDINSNFFNFFSQMIQCFLPVRMLRSPIKFESKLISDTLNRSEEHTSELQSRGHLVCRLLLEKKNIMHED